MGTRTLPRRARNAEEAGPQGHAKAAVRRNGVPGRATSVGAAEQVVSDLLRSRIDQAIDCEEPEVLIATLVAVAHQRSRVQAGSLMTYAFRRLRACLEKSPAARRKVWTWTRLCAARPEIEARELACALVDAFWREHRKDVERLTLNLARDEEREVRLYAASTMARVVRTNFRAHFRHMRAWSRHPDPSVRRQVIIATVAVADSEHPEWAKPLLDMLEPHLTDRDPYIRRNLGPFALGQGMLRVYPEVTLERFEKWLTSDNEIVRWNLAMAFTAPLVPQDWDRALDVLRNLAADRRRFVWGAAASALKNMANLKPRRMRLLVRRWMKDPALRVAISTAFNPSVR